MVRSASLIIEHNEAARPTPTESMNGLLQSESIELQLRTEDAIISQFYFHTLVVVASGDTTLLVRYVEVGL